MDQGLCNVIYLDRNAKTSGILRREDVGLRDGQNENVDGQDDISSKNIRAILATFSDVFVCHDGASCLKRISQFDDINTTVPTIVLLDIPYDEEQTSFRDNRTPSPTAIRRNLAVEKDEPIDIYGLPLLQHLSSSIHQRVLSRLILPIAVLASSPQSMIEAEYSSNDSVKCLAASDSAPMLRYLDAGAADVLLSPLVPDRVQGLPVHAYRMFKEVTKEDASSVLTKRNRKLSWIGIEEERPFAYLREAMVSGLMEGICNPESVVEAKATGELHVEESRKAVVKHAVGQWWFSAHDFTSDELVYAALMMLEHALQIPELDKWRISTSELTVFLIACRGAYNDFVLYHNFRHVVDVLQAVFYFLLSIGLLPSYHVDANEAPKIRNAVAEVLKPFDALTLLVAAIGHDVGHPGVNNAFLVALNAPLAQLYNDRSVLEAFHCAAYSQILRRYWPAAFSDIAMRKLMINSILATDMGLHFKYIMDMRGLQEKLAASHSSADGWSTKGGDENRDLVCGLLIKCADISNVARKYAVAAQWARILTDEFSNQGAMEKELNLPTCLFGGPPDPGDAIKMAESQIGFMNIFARPLFEGVRDILPAMQFILDELATNKAIWQEKIDAENSRKRSLMHGPIPGLSGHTATRSAVTLNDVDASTKTDSTPSNPSEKDSFFTSRSSHQTPDQIKLNSFSMSSRQGDSLNSSSDADVRRSSSGRVNSIKEGRTVTVLDSRPPISSPYGNSIYGQPASPSRRSSKDMALESMDQLRQRTSCSRSEIQGIDGLSPSQASSPVKSTTITTNVNDVDRSDPSSRSHATSNATADTNTTISPSTNPSSLEDGDIGPTDKQTPIPSTENPYLHPNQAPSYDVRQDQHAASAPDVLSGGGVSPGKSSIMSQATSREGEDGVHSLQDEKRDMRSSRSHSRLRGLKFWRKRWKSPDFEVEESP